MTVSTNASRLRRVVGHSCGCPFGLSSETGLLVTISFSGSDRMDNVLKDHRCPRFASKERTRTWGTVAPSGLDGIERLANCAVPGRVDALASQGGGRMQVADRN